MAFEFYSPTRILFGVGAIAEVAPEARAMGQRALIVTGADTTRVAPLVRALSDSGVASTLFSIPTEPTVDQMQEGVQSARRMDADIVIGFGGGSAIDGAKAIAALAGNSGPIEQYLEVIGEGRLIERPPLPFIAAPTTAGTGAEVTRNAVVKVPRHGVKVSMRSPLMLPKLAVVDPEVTLSMSRETTAATGLDALTQVLEPFVSKKATPITDALCRDGLRLAARSLRKAFEHGGNISARSDMCRVSLFGGLALANAKLGAVHGFAGPLGGMFDAPHGVICGRLLPPVVAANVAALKKQADTSPVLEKFDEIAKILTGDPAAVAEDAVQWISDLGSALELAPLSRYGITPSDIDDIVAKSKNASSMKGNPIELVDDELKRIIEQVL
jgi:alcohol dehydrogenase class IV